MRWVITRAAFATLACVVASGAIVAARSMVTPQGSAAPTATTTAKLNADLETGGALFRQGKVLEARALFESILTTARASGLAFQEARALVGLAEVSYENNQNVPTRRYALDALVIFERLGNARERGRTSQLLGLVANRIGDFADAKQHFVAAIAAFESAGERAGRVRATLGLLSVDRQAPENEGPLQQRNLDDAIAIDDVTLQAQTLHSWGDHLFTAGQYEPALDKLEQAAALFERANEQVGLGTVYNSLGRLYRAHGRVDAALSYQLKALAVHEKTKSMFNRVQSLNAVAVTYQALGDTRQAHLYFDRALELAEGSTSIRIQDLLRANIASSLVGEGEYARAAAMLESVLTRGVDAYPVPRYVDLAFAYLRLGRGDEALATVDKAIALCEKQETRPCISALDLRAEIHGALGDNRAALADLKAALDRIETMRGKLVPADFFKQQFNHAQEDVYSHAIALEVGQQDARTALETAEVARSRAFIDLLASRDIHIDRADRTAVSLPLTLRGAPAAPGNGRERPTLATATPARASELTATAARLHSTLLVYWVASDRVFIWVVKATGEIHAASVNVRESALTELVRATTPFSESEVALQASKPAVWRQLYDLLVQPVRAQLPAAPGALLTIVPHGPLGALAFAALQSERGRYLLEDYTLHYVPAGAVLQFTAGRRHADARASGRVLLVADPALPPRSRLDQALARLPGARKEIDAIAQLLPRRRLTTIQDTAATETRIRSAVSDQAVLHFATHAIVRDDEPLRSYLALGSSEGTDRKDANDGLLSAEEIYGLNLDADLVVLSACRSAGGRVTGDGIATFARAFIYAGTPSLVASMWDVADEPTNRLLPDFYRAWLGGASKARALRSAQLRLLRDLRAGIVRVTTPAGVVAVPEHPVFWAGFALIGEPQ